MVDCQTFFKPRTPKLLQIGQTRHQSTPLYLYIQNIKLVSQFDTLCMGLDPEYLVYTHPNLKSMVDCQSFFKPRTPKLLQIGQTRHQSTPLYLYIQSIKLVSQFDTLCMGLDPEYLVYTQPNLKSMVDCQTFFKPRTPKVLQIGQTRHQSTPLYLYIQNIQLVSQFDTLCMGLDPEYLVYTHPNLKSMIDCQSFFKPRTPKLLQIGQTRHQSTPLYLYIQSIKLVSQFDTLCMGLDPEYLVYTHPNLKSMVDCQSFYKPRTPKLLQMGQTRHQSTPLYLYIQNIKLVSQFDTLCIGLDPEYLVYTHPNLKSMVDCQSFFKPRTPKLLQIGQTRHQSTPLYLYIQSIKLVSQFDTLCMGLDPEYLVYYPPES